MITAADFSKGNRGTAKTTNSKFVTAADFVKNKPPAPEKKPTLGDKVKQVAIDVTKSIVSPVATMIARPIQAGAELAGVSDQKVNEVTQKYGKGWIAPTPQNGADLKKDFGRAVETVAAGLPGKTIGATIAGGAAFGAGSSLEQGNDLISKETAKQAAIGGAAAGVLHTVGTALSNAFGKKLTAAEFLQKAKEKAPYTIPDAAEPPPGYFDKTVKALPAPKPVEPAPIQLGGRRTLGEITVTKAAKNPVTVDPKTGRFQTTYSSSGGQVVDNRVIQDTVKPGAAALPVPKEYHPQTGFEVSTNIPETPVKTKLVATGSRMPSVKGNTVTKEANDINNKLVSEGFAALNDAEKAKFDSITAKDQIEKVTNYMNTVPDQFRDEVLAGRVPRDVHPQVAFNAVKNKAIKDGDWSVLRDLAKSPIATQESKAGQTLAASQILNGPKETDPVKLIQMNDANIAANFEKKTGQNLEKATQEAVQEIKAKKPKVTKQSFSDFINNITC